MIPKTLKAWVALVALLAGVAATTIINVRNYEAKWSGTVRDRGAKTDKVMAEILANQVASEKIATEKRRQFEASLDAQNRELEQLAFHVRALGRISADGVEALAMELSGRVEVIHDELIEARRCQTLSAAQMAAFGDSLATIKAKLATLELIASARTDSIAANASEIDTTGGRWWNPFD